MSYGHRCPTHNLVYDNCCPDCAEEDANELARMMGELEGICVFLKAISEHRYGFKVPSQLTLDARSLLSKIEGQK